MSSRLLDLPLAQHGINRCQLLLLGIFPDRIPSLVLLPLLLGVDLILGTPDADLVNRLVHVLDRARQIAFFGLLVSMIDQVGADHGFHPVGVVREQQGLDGGKLIRQASHQFFIVFQVSLGDLLLDLSQRWRHRLRVLVQRLLMPLVEYVLRLVVAHLGHRIEAGIFDFLVPHRQWRLPDRQRAVALTGTMPVFALERRVIESAKAAATTAAHAVKEVFRVLIMQTHLAHAGHQIIERPTIQDHLPHHLRQFVLHRRVGFHFLFLGECLPNGAWQC